MSRPLIVFDLDGTLVDTAPDLVATLNLIFEREGLPPVPYDEARGLVPNEAGRVVDAPGVYVAGWAKRGPSGGIGTNRWDARETVATLLADLVPSAV